MNPEWQKIQTQVGLKRSADDLVYTTAPDAVDVLCALSSESVLHVTGEDAESSLQAQFSNDIAALPVLGSQLTTWSTPKGRVITVIRVTRIDGGYLLKLPTALLEPVLKRLQMYLRLPVQVAGSKVPRMAKVSMDPRDDLMVAGISGEQALKGLAEAGASKVPDKVNETAQIGDGWITRVPGEYPRFELIAPVSQMAELWSKLVSHSPPGAEAFWRLQNIDAAIPSVTVGTTEAFVLQMLNLQHIGGVSFKKGCFPGQEVVARMQYLGKLKRQMFRLQHTGDQVPLPGDEIFKAGGGSAAGKIVDAVSVEDGTVRMLAVLSIEATAEPLFLDKAASLPVELLEIPYDTPAPE